MTLLILFLIVVCATCNAGIGISKDIKNQIQERPDSGYTITLSGNIRHLSPITAEGAFPKEKIYYQIQLEGKGRDRSCKNQPGFYYSYPDNIECKIPHGDRGYASVNKTRKTIYFNFYWVKSPGSLEACVINGSYKIE